MIESGHWKRPDDFVAEGRTIAENRGFDGLLAPLSVVEGHFAF